MEIQGRIIAVLPKQSGVSQRTGTNWASQEYVIETHEQYPRKCCFRIFGEDKINAMNVQVGEELTVSFDIDAHEWNGRWFNEIRAWKVDRTPVAQPTAQPMAAAPVTPAAQPVAQPAAPVSSDPFGGGAAGDDLPF